MKKAVKFICCILLSAILFTTSQAASLAFTEAEQIKKSNEDEIDLEDFFSKAAISDYDISGVTFKALEKVGSEHVLTTVKLIPKDSEQAQELMAKAKKEVDAKKRHAKEPILIAASITPASPKMSSGTGTLYDYKWDGSLIIKIFTKLYYTTTNYRGLTYIHINKVTGGFYSESGSGHSVGNGTFVKENKIRIGQIGFGINGGYHTQYRDFNYSTSTRAFTAKPFSTWVPVCTEYSAAVGSTYTVKLKRGGSTWTVSLTNNICG